MSTEVIEVPITDTSIRLGQLLKLANVVENGALAREVIEAGLVTVAGETETRRGKQIQLGDVVEFDGREHGLPAVKLIVTQGDSA